MSRETMNVRRKKKWLHSCKLMGCWLITCASLEILFSNEILWFLSRTEMYWPMKFEEIFAFTNFFLDSYIRCSVIVTRNTFTENKIISPQYTKVSHGAWWWKNFSAGTTREGWKQTCTLGKQQSIPKVYHQTLTLSHIQWNSSIWSLQK